MQSFCHWEDDTLVLNILGRPRAKKTKLDVVGEVRKERLSCAH